MESFEEKKWFVYLGDHHEGPFSLGDLQSRMAEGHVTPANYVWCEGMADWQLITEVPFFAELVRPRAPAAAPAPIAAAAPADPVLTPEPDSSPFLTLAPEPAFTQAEPQPILVAEEPSVVPHPALSPAPAASAMAMAVAEPMTTLEPRQESSQLISFPDSAQPVEASPVETFVAPAAEAAPLSVGVPDVSAPASIAPARRRVGEETASGLVSRSEIASAEPLELQKQSEEVVARERDARNALAEEAIADAVPKTPFLKKALRVLRPLMILAVIAGLVFALAAGYFDAVLSAPSVKAFVATAGDFSRPFMVKLSDRVPILQKIVSPLPRIADISDSDYEDLRKAALAGASSGGFKVALGLTQTATEAGVTIFVASNMPDGTKFDLLIVGQPDTLLNQLSFVGSESVLMNKRLGKSGALHGAEGKPIPKGRYKIYLMESSDESPPSRAAVAKLATAQKAIGDLGQPLPPGVSKDARVLLVKDVFLGGPKDDTYEARLKEFHQKLSSKAADELKELHQFSDTLQSQLGATNDRFAAVAKAFKNGKLAPAKRKEWETFDQNWTQLSGTLSQSFAKWTPAALDQEYFYGVLYQLVVQAAQAIDFVHKWQQTYMLPNSDRVKLDEQLKQSVTLAETTLGNLKAKIDQAEKIPPTPNGMPQREGL